MFCVSPAVDIKSLEHIFRHKVLKMLLAKGKISRDMITLLDKWRHTGFNVFCVAGILPRQQNAMENPARYTYPPMFVTDHPGFFLPGKDDLPSANRPGRLSIKGRKRDQGVRCAGMARRHAWRGEAMRRRVFPCAQQGRADGPIIWPLQQRGARQTKKDRH